MKGTSTGRLRVRTRPKVHPGEVDHNWTLFARLSPRVAQTLHDEACLLAQRRDGEAGWYLSQSRSGSPDFLPLCLSGFEGDPAYVSYNGGSIAEEDSIELAAGIVPEGVSHVIVTPLAFIPTAASVEMEPLSVSDWESLELYAQLLEEGALLQQVTVVYQNQVLSLRVGSNSELVQVRVKMDPVVCQLVADTEVHVMPKLRQYLVPEEMVLRVLPSWDDFSPAMQELALRSDIEIPRIQVPPCSVLVHPNTLEQYGIANGSVVVLRKDDRETRNTAVARVDCCDGVDKRCAVLHRLLRYQMGVSSLDHHVRVQSIGSIDSSHVREMVRTGAVSFTLERVQLASATRNKECPWRYPDHVRDHGLARDTCCRRDEIPCLTQLRSILAFWLDLPDCLKGLPLGPGSLILLPWNQESTGPNPNPQEVYILQAHFQVDQEVCEQHSAESMCFLAKDLPYLLSKLSSAGTVQSSDEAVSTVSQRDMFLNILPPTVDLHRTASNDLTSGLSVDVKCFDGLVLTGEDGSGKTHTALVFAARARLSKAYATLYLDCKRLQSAAHVRMRDILQALTQIFEEAKKAWACTVILDDLDELIPNVNMGDGADAGSAHQQQPNPVAVDQANLIADHLQGLQDEVLKSPGQGKVFFVITCRDEQSVHPSVLSEQFYRVADVPSFGADDRERLFSAMLGDVNREHALADVGTKTEGFRPRDLEIVATRTVHSFLQRGLRLSECHGLDVSKAVDRAMLGYVPTSRQGITTEDTGNSVTWSQVGGLYRVKELLASTILRPVKYRRVYQHAPIRLPRGILLFGPPGCGKSFLIPALAKECGLTLITCRGPELLDRYIGASEAKVRQLFQRAFAAAPSLLFLDEFDALAPVRGSDHTGVTDRVVNQLLTYLDGVEDTTAGAVFIVAATSRPDKVDPALLRPGRLEQHVFVGFPASKDEWHDVLEKVLVHNEINSLLRENVKNGTLWEIDNASHIRSFSPADLKAVVDTAYLNAVHDYLDYESTEADNEPGVTIAIEMPHMAKALQATRPSLSVNDRRMLNKVYTPFVGADNLAGADIEARNEQPVRLRTALK